MINWDAIPKPKVCESFLKAEEIKGFFVEEKMKRSWASMILVLWYVTKVCEIYNIPYFADYGTLLGTIRHGGFIPWDDDIDIAVKRKDYMRLMPILQKELPKECVVYSFYTQESYDVPKAFVTNRKYIDFGNSSKEAWITKKFYNCPYVVGVDIFPFDEVPRDDKEKELLLAVYGGIYDAAFRFNELKERGELEDYIHRINDTTGTRLTINESNLQTKLWRLSDKVAMMYDESECDSYVWLPDVAASGDFSISRKKEWLYDFLKLPFEYIDLQVPIGYNEILKKNYGQDYLSPRQAKAGHDYPFYAVQDEKIRTWRQL